LCPWWWIFFTNDVTWYSSRNFRGPSAHSHPFAKGLGLHLFPSLGCSRFYLFILR
jgi:hypothetical protein